MKSIIECAPRIMVFNPKGGVGKTAISLNLALTLDYGIITNDVFSVVGDVLPKSKYKVLSEGEDVPDYPEKIPIVYDFGGFIDPRIRDLLKKVDWLIIPINTYEENLQAALDFFEEVISYRKKKIMVVVNKGNFVTYQAVLKVITKLYPMITVFNLKRSKAFTRMILEKKSIQELANGNALFKYHFQPVIDQFNRIINYIWGEENDIRSE